MDTVVRTQGGYFMEQCTRTAVLTAEQIRFLRSRLDRVVFRHKHGGTTLEARQKGTNADLVIDCKFTFRGYGFDGYTSTHETPVAAFVMIHTPEFDDVWQTIAKLFRAGDEVELEFSADGNSNGYVKAAKANQVNADTAERICYDRLHVDTLKLHIRREGKRALSLKGAEQLCP